MTITELEAKLNIIGVPTAMYSIGKGGLPNEVFCLMKEAQWNVYYSERGRKTGLRVFEAEAESCQYFYDKLKSYGTI